MPLDPALLAAIIAEPDADLPRLLAADWLDENGEPERAEFIRVQCELARPCERSALCGRVRENPKDYCNFHEELRRRERALYDRHAPELFPEWPHCSALTIDAACNLPIHGFPKRGFIETVQCSWSDWQEHADAIRAATPLRKVRLTTWPHNCERPPKCPIDYWESDRLGDAGRVHEFLAWQYPGIEFQLPQYFSYQEQSFEPLFTVR